MTEKLLSLPVQRGVDGLRHLLDIHAIAEESVYLLGGCLGVVKGLVVADV